MTLIAANHDLVIEMMVLKSQVLEVMTRTILDVIFEVDLSF